MNGIRLMVRKTFVTAAILLAVVVGMPGLSAGGVAHGAPKSGGRHTLTGHLVRALQGAHALRATDPARSLYLVIGLPLRNTSQAKALLAAQNDRHSAQYHRYLTPAQFTASFGPTQATVDAVTSYLTAQGLRVSTVAPNHLIIDATGTVAVVERAFAVQINDYTLGGRTVYAPASEPSVPDTLANDIQAIVGLDDVAQPQPMSHAAPGHPVRPSRAKVPAYCPPPSISPDGGATPQYLRDAYDVNSLLNSADGTGQTIALLEAADYSTGDINQYRSEYCIPAATSSQYSTVLVDGGPSSLDGSYGIEFFEAEGDLEIISAMAPGASQIVYEIPEPATRSITYQIDGYNRIVNDDQAKVVSTSLAWCEADVGFSSAVTLDNAFLQGAMQGQTVFAASGDGGEYGCYTGSASSTSTKSVESPAGDFYVVGVGGTQFYGTPPTETEYAWSDASTTDNGRWPNGVGSGGGVNDIFGQTLWQFGPGVNNAYSDGSREVPDVAALADGYSTYCASVTAPCSSVSPWRTFIGTSGGAPLWAGLAADINEYVNQQGDPGLGWSASLLYSLFQGAQPYAPYRDITTGGGTPPNPAFAATSGYDLSTGIGSPDAWNIARDVASIETAVPNDDFANATYIVSPPYSIAENVTQATIGADDPSDNICGTVVGSQSVWFQFTPIASVTLTSSTAGSNYETVLAAWTGTRGLLTEVACGHVSGGTAQMTFAASANTTYYIEASAYNQSSPAMLNLTLIATAPPNDDFNNAMAITPSATFTQVEDYTDSATTAADDPATTNCGAGIGVNAHSVWYSITPSTTAPLTVSTLLTSSSNYGYTDYNTVLAAWTGTRGHLTQVACNNDSFGYSQSQMIFTPTLSITYYIEVMSLGTSPGGQLALSIYTQPPNDDINNTLSAQDWIENTTNATTVPSDPTLTNCGTGNGVNSHSVWFLYESAYTTPVKISTAGSSYNTVLAVFTGSPGSLTQVVCNDDRGGGTTSLVTYPLAAYTPYWVEVTSHGSSPGGTLDLTVWTPTSTTGVFRPSNGTLYLKNSNTTGNADIAITYGLPGDKPVTGDWTGKGYKTIGVYRSGQFLLRNANTTGYADIAFYFGASTDKPVAGDWTGKGYDSIGLFRNGTWYLRNSNSAGAPDITIQFGTTGDIPVVGDWTGQGKDTIGVFRPSNATFYLRNSNTAGPPDIVVQFGLSTDQPIVGDWDGNGSDTIGVYRNGTYYLRNTNSAGSADLSFTLGIAGDVPIGGPWVLPVIPVSVPGHRPALPGGPKHAIAPTLPPRPRRPN